MLLKLSYLRGKFILSTTTP